MYGTIARMKTEKGALEELKKMGTGRQPAGYIGSYVFKSDKDPNEFWMVAIFKDKETYFANANSPEQDKEFRNLKRFLKSEPDWHDGEIVFENKAGK
jgi:quinol monooxygenase YgiN